MSIKTVVKIEVANTKELFRLKDINAGSCFSFRSCTNVWVRVYQDFVKDILCVCLNNGNHIYQDPMTQVRLISK